MAKIETGIMTLTFDTAKDALGGMVRVHAAKHERQDTMTPVRFKERFSDPPQVMVALCGLVLLTPNSEARPSLAVEPKNITRSGFDIHLICGEQNNLECITVSWLAITES